MSDLSDAFLRKAEESLAGAASELTNGRYNNAANRAYYACFQAAVAALDLAGIRPPGGREDWGHGFVQGQFAGELVARRKRYPADLRGALAQVFALRAQADYKLADVSQAQATRAVARARAFVAAITARGGTSR
ncbi:MAG TPA: HEPN domain-containing protein [Thermomicrobiales bacterium]|nr:HEPN domain-containing protein [Thermomicrobiales bacterium]